MKITFWTGKLGRFIGYPQDCLEINRKIRHTGLVDIGVIGLGKIIETKVSG